MDRVLSFDVGTKHLAMCDMGVSADGSFEVYQWAVASCVPDGLNVNKTPVHDLAPEFYGFVKNHLASWITPGKGPIKRIFIENQPLGTRGAARNLKTKVLSHILQCMLIDALPDTKVLFVHPGLKLKDMPRDPEKKATYRENKAYAVSKTAELMKGPQCKACAGLQDFEKSKKKDDLADAFLQGLLAGQLYARGDVLAPPSDPTKAIKASPAKKAKRAGPKKASVADRISDDLEPPPAKRARTTK